MENLITFGAAQRVENAAKENRKFNPRNMSTNVQKLNNISGKAGEKNYDIVRKAIIQARHIIKEKVL